ncbi:MAG: S-ribosylhomocysteine lyase [Muribaculaceae bacterium]|nr:S-ribosylhomocysteine lyase [Muribaculaceae bacterium]
MEKIASFMINHEKLERGIFVSRKDLTPSGDTLTTFDIRMKRPNREPALDPRAIHTIEHLAATYLRNEPQWRESIVYWGPMGCLTGNYLILSGNFDSTEILNLMRDTFSFIADFEGDIPGATARDCGNYTFNDLELAKKEARKFLHEVIENPQHCNLNYPDD